MPEIAILQFTLITQLSIHCNFMRALRSILIQNYFYIIKKFKRKIKKKNELNDDFTKWFIETFFLKKKRKKYFASLSNFFFCFLKKISTIYHLVIEI